MIILKLKNINYTHRVNKIYMCMKTFDTNLGSDIFILIFRNN